MSKTDKKTEIIADQLIISKDQNTVTYLGHTATFKPYKSNRNTCTKCWFHRFTAACWIVPCSALERDGYQEGIFTIQEMPEIKK